MKAKFASVCRPALAVSLLCLAAAPASADPIVKLLTFQDVPDPVAATTVLTYTLQVTNTSFTSSAANVQLTVPIPAGATFIAADDPACTFTAPNVVCALGTLAASAERVVNITLRPMLAGGSTITSTATATSTTAGESPSSVPQTTTISAGADLQLAMSGSPNPVVAGGLASFVMNVTNLGPDASSGITLTDTLPTNTSFASFSGAGWSCSASGQTVTCTHPAAVAVNASSAVTVVARVNSSINGTITNSATVSATTPDGLPSNNTATASVSVVQGANLNIGKSVSPSPVISAGATTFTLTPRNAGPDAASTVTVTDTLPAGFSAIAASGPGWSCTANQGTRLVSCTRASLAVGSTNNITITATAPDDTIVPPGGMSASNSAQISATTQDPVGADNTGTVNFTLQRDGADLTITKTKGPNPVAQGSAITSVMTMHNNGPRAAAGTLTITDTLPAGESYTGPGSFTSNAWNCSFSSGVFSCSLPGPLAVGANAPALTLVTTATGTGSLTNIACTSVSGAVTDPNNTNDCASASITSTGARADITIVKSQDRSTVATTDGSVTYTLTLTNAGPDDSASISVSDVIPMYTSLAGGTVITANAGTGSKGSTGSCSVSGATVNCSYATLRYASGAPANTAETAAITITVQRPMADGSFTNSASIDSSAVGDPDRSNNASSVITTVAPVADVQVQSKTVTPGTVRAGVDATYVITLLNAGPSTAQNVTLDDVFAPAGGDPGFAIRSFTPSQGTCSYGGGNTLSCAIGTMGANSTQTVTIVARPAWMASPPANRALPNTATVATTTTDSNPANNSRGATLNIDAAAVDMIANISDVPSFAGVPADPLGYDGTAPANNLVTYRMVLTNSGPSQATGVSVNTSYAAPSGKAATFLCDSDSQFACSGVPQCTTANATANPQVLSCTAPNLEAGTSSTRYLRYRINDAPAATGDPYANTIVVSTNETESNSGNNTAVEPTAVRAKADLSVSSKTAVVAAPPLQYGQTFQWQIKVLNNGPGDAHDSVLTDTLPTNMELVSPFTYSIANGAGTCTASGLTQFSCNLGSITPGAGSERTVTVDVLIRRPATGPFPSSYTNTASVSTSSVDLVPGNDSNSGVASLVKSSIAGRVYRDNNNNATIDGGELGVAGVALTLSGTDVFGTTVSRNATTDASGNYLFDNLEQAGAGGYPITESTQPAGFTDGLESVGTAATGTPPGGTAPNTANSDVITNVVLDKNQSATGYNFGELRQNTLSGLVYADIDNNGVRAGSEPASPA